MKRLSVALIAVSLLSLLPGCTGPEKAAPRTGLQGKITLSGAWALYPMAVRWAEEFQKLHPGVAIDVSAGGAGKGMADALSQASDLGMVSREVKPAEIEKGAWWVSVVKDAVVPTVNERCPGLPVLLGRGLTREELAAIWVTGKAGNWGEFTGDPAGAPIHVYTRSDACGAAQTWAEYLGCQQEDLRGVGVYGDPGLAESVRKDPAGVGYNNINYAYDPKTKKPVPGIRVIPIDLNGDGRIDATESFYGDQTGVTAAIRTGKYPSPPARNLHLVAGGLPQRKVVLEFLRWVLTDGQRYVSETGYIELAPEKLQEELDKLSGAKAR
jgi:phosphate transport system substrate-binding protein